MINKMKQNISNGLKIKKCILVILDGWGIMASSKGNAISLASTPNYDNFLKRYPHTELIAHGLQVGLLKDQDGNSEAGHINIGAGRNVLQDDIYINKAIKDGLFDKNLAFLEAINHVQKNKSKLHLMGLLSGIQSAHVNPEHLDSLLNLLEKKGVKNVYLHLFTDGRDSSQHASINFLKDLKSNFKNGEKIATIMGRFYAMDRNKNWSRTKKAYEAMTLGKGIKVESPEEAIVQAYNREESDEFIKPTVITKKGQPIVKIKNNDAIVFFNLRSDRARQLTKLFVQQDLYDRNKNCKINRKKLKNLKFVSMTDFGPDLDGILAAFPSRDIKDTLPMQLKDYRQLYISESEKYAHVTYFFNGGYKDPIAGENREKIPSPHVRSYAQRPEMNSKILTEKIIDYILKDKYDFITVNFPNPDMVGHTGDLKAGIKAVETVDYFLGLIYKALQKKKDFAMIITADHGNIEEMINLKTGEIDTKHSCASVPFILIHADLKKKRLCKGKLGDIAPTILDIFGLKKPHLMTGKSLLK